jgi:hypothetical protein
MKGSFASRDRRCSDSAHTNAGALWSAFGSGNGIGGNTNNERVPDDLRSSRHIDPPPRFDLHSACPRKDGTRVAALG